MEPDPLPWLIFALTLLFVGLATALEVIVTVFNRSEIRRKFAQGDPLAQLLDELIDNTPVLFITLGLLKNMGLVLLGAASAWLALQAQSTQVMFWILGSWLLLTLLQPVWRAFILQHAEYLVFQLASLLRIFMVLLRPLTFAIYQINSWAHRHGPMRVEDGAGLTDETLRLLMNTTESTEEMEEIEENEREMIASILEMNDTVVREVMVPRIDMVAIDAETTFHEALDTIISAGHSRIPVYEEHIDHIKDFIRQGYAALFS